MKQPILLLLSPVFTLALSLLLSACGAGPGQAAQATTSATLPVTPLSQAGTETSTGQAQATAPPTPTPIPTSTPPPTETAVPTPKATPVPLVTATLTTCDARIPPDDELLTLVNRDYGLSRDYEPGDLVPLSDHFSNTVTLGYPTEVRTVIIAPLQEIIAAMREDDLNPQIISGYRSFSAQTLALQKWLEQYPDWAANLSAPPGHSEHQLGTTVDFGSPELAEMLGEEFIQFHPAFAETSEGQWLAEQAHEYGFVMSYPEGGFERTGFYYEPWHFRYVGRELAAQLVREGITISEYLLQTQPPPCVP